MIAIFLVESSAMEIYLSTWAGTMSKKQRAGWNIPKNVIGCSVLHVVCLKVNSESEMKQSGSV